MKEKRGNQNVQKVARKRFIDQIVSCVCLEDHYGSYILNMKLHPLGEYGYYEYKGKNSVKRVLGNKTFYLTEDAEATIKKEIGYYKVSISKMIAWPSRKYLRDKNIRICFKSAAGGGYTYYVGFRNREGKKGTQYRENVTLESIITNIIFITTVLDPKYEKTLLPALKEPTEKSIKNNPLYIAARKVGDREFLNKLRKYYGLPEEKERKNIMKLFHRRVLPELPEEYNKDYIVSCKDIDVGLLRRSGYVIRHRPYFATFNSTHEAWQLNPYSKLGVDAAPDDQTPISFKEYLKMFEDQE